MKLITYVRGKITMPQLPDRFIASDRIKKICPSIAGKRTVLITAPSGYGKTTFMIYALTSCIKNGDRICWYHLDNWDADLKFFYANLMEALFPSDDPQWKSIYSTLQDFSDFKTEYRYINAAICQELWTCNDKNQRIYLALDDFQNVNQSSEIAETISYFADNFPTSCTILISSRERPNIAVGKNSLNSTALEIDLKDLSFSEKDISSFFVKFSHSKVEKSIIDKIYQKTGGWQAGVIMFSQLISVENQSDIKAILEQPLQGTMLFDYIATEVLKNIDPTLMMFLVKVCILQDFSANDAKELLHIDNPRRLISECERAGLFIQKTIRNGEVFFFHSLFRETLLFLQKEYLSEDEIQELHLHAGMYYRKINETARSIDHYIQSKNTNATIAMLESENVDMFRIVEAYPRLKAWLSTLPDEVIEKYPNILFTKGYINVRDETAESILLIEKASKKYEESDNFQMQLNLLLLQINFCTSSYERMDKASGYSKQALRILRKMPCSAERDSIRWVFLFIISVCQEKFTRALEMVISLGPRTLPDDWRFQLLMVATLAAFALGDFIRAEAICKKALETDLCKKVDIFRGFCLTSYSTALCFKNDPAAELVGTELDSLCVKHNVDFFTGFSTRASAFRLYASNQANGALELLDKSIDCFISEEVTALTAHARLLSMLWRFDEKTDKDKLYTDALTILSQLHGLHSVACFLEICQSLVGAIARECGRTAEAKDLLVRAYESGGSKGAKHIACGTLLHLGRLYLDEGQPEEARNLLEKAMAVISLDNYSIFWDIQLSTMNRVLIFCIKTGIYADYANKLMNQYFGVEAVAYVLSQLPSVSYDQLRDFSERLFQRYSEIEDSEVSDILRIRFFGSFNLSVNGTVIPSNRLATTKIKGLIQYLAFHHGTVISKDRLTDILWHELSRESADKALKTSIGDLNKTLREYGLKMSGFSEPIQENSNGFVMNLKISIIADIDEIRKEYNKYKRLKKSYADKSEIKQTLQKILAIYSDGLLKDDLTSSWIAEAKEEFDSIYIEISSALAMACIKDNEYAEAEPLLLHALDLDPYNEDLCLNIMNLYVASGRKSNAIGFYYTFKKRMINEREAEPDSRIQALAAYIKSVGDAQNTFDVFISHSSKDKKTADAVCASLEAANIKCWIAPRDIIPGKEWGEAIVDAISLCKIMVLIFSGNSNFSKQVSREVESAVRKELQIIPFRIENVNPTGSMEYYLYTQHWFDAFMPPLEPHIGKLTNMIYTQLNKLSDMTSENILQ